MESVWGPQGHKFSYGYANVPGEHRVKENPLVDINKVLLPPPLHIKLGWMKNFVKGLDKNGAAFQYLSTEFPGFSAAELKENIFVGP